MFGSKRYPLGLCALEDLVDVDGGAVADRKSLLALRGIDPESKAQSWRFRLEKAPAAEDAAAVARVYRIFSYTSQSALSREVSFSSR